MTLDTENAKLFFKLFLPILDYVNLKCHVLENDEKFMEKWTLSQGINIQSALKTANKLNYGYGSKTISLSALQCRFEILPRKTEIRLRILQK